MVPAPAPSTATRRASRPLCAAALLAAAGVARAGVPIDAFWQNPAGGLWGLSTNWSTDPDVPNNGAQQYNAFLSLAGAYTVTLDLDVIINNLTIDAAGGPAVLELANFNLTTLGQLTVSNDNEIIGNGTGEFTASAGATFTGARIRNIPRFRAFGSTVFNSSGLGDEICDTDFEYETLAWAGGADLMLNNTAVLRGPAGSTFTIQGDAAITTMMGSPLIDNAGTIIKAAGAGAATITDIPVVNTGLIRVQSGTLAISGAAASLDNTGAIRIDAGRELSVESGASLTNFAAGVLSGGVYDVAGSFRFDTGGIGVTTIDAELILDGPASQIIDAVSATDALAPAASITPAGSLDLRAARDFTTSGDFDNQGRITIESGSAFTVPGGSSLNGVESSGVLSGGRFEVAGTLRFDTGAPGLQTIDAQVILSGPASALLRSDDTDALQDTTLIGSAGTLELRDGRDLTTGGSFTVADTGRLTVGLDSVFEVPDEAGNQLTNFNTGVLADGLFEIQGTLRAPNLAVQTIGLPAQPVSVTLDGTQSRFENSQGDDAFSALQTIETGSSLALLNGRSLEVAADLTVRGSLVIDAGPLRGEPAAGTLRVAGDYRHEAGSLALAGGVLEVVGQYLHTAGAITGFGLIDLNITEGAARGAGSLLSSAGLIAPSGPPGDSTGVLTVNGDYAQLPGARIELDIGGLHPDDYDRLVITGHASFFPGDESNDPALVVISFKDGFEPMPGMFFNLIAFGSRSPQLPAVSVAYNGPWVIDFLWQADGLTMGVFVPAPGAGALLVLAAAFPATRRRYSSSSLSS